ncbi:glycosyltransferase family A protein [Arenibacter sp. GZD96]|uniref:glycosyltransferase family 2 protein n=1 Tax=Aurantibrevibacter litoralis TaxID=3106030 RepID=UPI002AFF9F91|nr:glycosyltransferase family A protein [Arenibacter sp. GZD-96]MEA1785930.1 glycosyltransferase family A protein [Arenibacter sp. GZD-96]
MKYCIIIPAHNEEAFLALTLNSVLTQSLPPKKVIVVNDNSTDETEAIIERFTAKSALIQKRNTLSSTAHIPGSKVINAFHKGLEILNYDFDFIVKLDADVILPENYFEKIASLFQKYPKAGIVGGFAYEQEASGEWQLNHPMDKNHVRGAFKAYSKSCFKAIGGLKNAMGWDTVDELLARYHGFEILTDDSLKVKHLRPTGKGYNAKAKLLQGKAMYAMRYGFWITCIASAKMAWKQRNYQVIIDNLKGFFGGKKENMAFIVTPQEGRFIRQLRWKNIRSKLLLNGPKITNR